MYGIEDNLQDIEQMLSKGQRDEPEKTLSGLITTMGKHELQVWESDFRRLFESFFPKRRRTLTALLDSRLFKTDGKDTLSEPIIAQGIVELKDAADRFERELFLLRRHHIFQWSTYYSDAITQYFFLFLGLSLRNPQLDCAQVVTRLLSVHASEIFTHGFERQTQELQFESKSAIIKSLDGLGRFLNLPIGVYSAKASQVAEPDEILNLRKVCSSFLSGIIKGYAMTKFDQKLGCRILERNLGNWAHYVPFLTQIDLVSVLDAFADTDVQTKFSPASLTLTRSLDLIASGPAEIACLPSIGHYNWQNEKLETSLRPPPDTSSSKLIEIHVYLDETQVSVEELKEGVRKGITIIVAPLRADTFEAVRNDSQLAQKVVDLDFRSSPSQACEAIQERFVAELGRRRSTDGSGPSLTYNCARGFPLHNPERLKYFHVERSSVRDLAQMFERRNGIRLWCSIRRSGKTTACFDLSERTGGSMVVSQTCDGTSQRPQATYFYDKVTLAITDKQQIDKTFFSAIVKECAMSLPEQKNRCIFVIDEYETLFGRLRSALKADPEIRYTVVQPLLNQMTVFSRENLLVLLGQHPNAHYILMDQNQLSAYVEQDPFPLFQHTAGTTIGEFSELVRTVLTDTIPFGSGFVDAVFEETSGHPYLTVNLLVEVVDWLIENHRTLRGLRLSAGDVKDFTVQHLTKESVALSVEYDFFRAAIAEATSVVGRNDNPWLHAVYKMLGMISDRWQQSSTCSMVEFAELTREIDLGGLGFSVEQLLRTATQANFLNRSEDSVSVKVRLLGRIASATRPNISA